MENFLNQFNNIFAIVIECIVILIELVGVILLVYVFARAVISIIRKQDKIAYTFTKGFMLALQLLTAGELLQTIVVHSYEHLIILGGVVAIRLAMGLFSMKELHEAERLEHKKKMDYLNAELTTAEEIREHEKAKKDILD